MGTLSSSSASHLIRCRFILRPTLPCFHSSINTNPEQFLIIPLQTPSSFSTQNPAAYTPFPTNRLFFSSTPLLHEPAKYVFAVQNEQDDFDEGGEVESKKDTVKEGLTRVLDLSAQRIKSSNSKLPTLTVKEKKELASYAHGLGKKLKSQQVGKSGVTDTVITALIETLEANELLKLKIHSNCPAELDDAMKQLEEATGSVVLSQIGRTVILYRPSLTKLKEEEDKTRRAQKVFARKQQALNRASQALMTFFITFVKFTFQFLCSRRFLNLVALDENRRVEDQQPWEHKNNKDNRVVVNLEVADIEVLYRSMIDPFP